MRVVSISLSHSQQESKKDHNPKLSYDSVQHQTCVADKYYIAERIMGVEHSYLQASMFMRNV